MKHPSNSKPEINFFLWQRTKKIAFLEPWHGVGEGKDKFTLIIHNQKLAFAQVCNPNSCHLRGLKKPQA